MKNCGGAKKDTSQGDELDLLCTLVESWEMQHYPILPPDPVDAILFRMEQMELSKTDMAKYLGSQSRVSEILARKRKLTLKMVKSLYKGLHIPAEVLLAKLFRNPPGDFGSPGELQTTANQ